MTEKRHESLLQQVLRLPYEDRRKLLEQLTESLHRVGREVDPEAWRGAWGPEIQRRMADVDAGETHAVLLESVWPDIAGDHE